MSSPTRSNIKSRTSKNRFSDSKITKFANILNSPSNLEKKHENDKIQNSKN